MRQAGPREQLQEGAVGRGATSAVWTRHAAGSPRSRSSSFTGTSLLKGTGSIGAGRKELSFFIFFPGTGSSRTSVLFLLCHPDANRAAMPGGCASAPPCSASFHSTTIWHLRMERARANSP